MGLLYAVLTLGAVIAAQLPAADSKLDKSADSHTGQADTPATLSALPTAPKGKATVIGGVIRKVDPIRDQLLLSVYGPKTVKIKILFDERTQVFRDGVKASLRDVRPEDRAAVETVLDGTNIFALSIHMLSKAPLGECQGQILSYNPSTGELSLSDSLSSKAINLVVPAGTPINHVGQNASSEGEHETSGLVRGALVSVKFESDTNGHGIAHQIEVLAAPGSPFDFEGTITHIDQHSGILAVMTSDADSSYKISFDPARFPETRNLHEGAKVRIAAVFDGTRYVASKIESD